MYNVGRIAGIRVLVHWTFLALLGWVWLGRLATGRSLGEASVAVTVVLLVFASVVLHELGHALVARRFEVVTRSITLLPIGGLAAMERIPDRPRQELAIAVAGPAVNVGLALLFLALLLALDSPLTLADTGAIEGALLVQLLWINVSLALFNLLPAFPMDGGRVLRALLALRFDRPRATDLAALVGKVIAVLLGFAGLVTSPILVVIALFIWFGGNQEADAVARKADLAGLPVNKAMTTEFRAVAPDDVLRHVSELALGGTQGAFPVVDAGRVVGIVTRDDLLRGLDAAGPAAPVHAIMNERVAVVDAAVPLTLAFERVSPGSTVVVTDRGRVAGMLTAEGIDALIKRRRIQRALAIPG